MGDISWLAKAQAGFEKGLCLLHEVRCQITEFSKDFSLHYVSLLLLLASFFTQHVKGVIKAFNTK
jgi:hypothetical protein